MARRPDRPPIGSTRSGSRAAGTRSGSSGGGPSRSGAGSAGARSSRSGSAEQADPGFTRPALAPGLLTAVVLLACVALVGSGPFVFVRWGVTVLALIVLVFAIRGRSWVGIVITAVVVVLWNPLVVIPVPGQIWAALQVVAAAAFIAVGILVKVPRDAA